VLDTFYITSLTYYKVYYLLSIQSKTNIFLVSDAAKGVLSGGIHPWAPAQVYVLM